MNAKENNVLLRGLASDPESGPGPIGMAGLGPLASRSLQAYL